MPVIIFMTSIFHIKWLISKRCQLGWKRFSLALNRALQNFHHLHFCRFSYAYIQAKLLSRVWLFATPWTVARQAPLSMGFSRQEYWSGLPCLPPGDLPDPGIEPRSLLHCRQIRYHMSHWGSCEWVQIQPLQHLMIPGLYLRKRRV